MSTAVSGAWLVVLAVLCTATIGPAWRFGQAAGISPLVFLLWRSALGGAALAIALASTRRLSGGLGRSAKRLGVAALVMTLSRLTVLLAFSKISIGLALILYYLYPTLVVLGSRLLFKEPIGRELRVPIGVQLLGLTLVLGWPSGGVDAFGVLLAVASAALQAAFVLTVRGSTVDPGGSSLVYLAFGTVAFLALVLVQEPGAVATSVASGSTFLLLLWVGVIGTAIPTVAFVVGIRRAGASRAAMLGTLEPVFGAALAALLLGEAITGVQIAGGALVLGGALLSQMRVAPAIPPAPV